MTKMTYVNALEIAIATVENAEAKAKLEALKTSIAKKNSAERKPTATQKANEGYKVAILEFLAEGGKHTITEIMKGCGALISVYLPLFVSLSKVVRWCVKRLSVRLISLRWKAVRTPNHNRRGATPFPITG